MGLRIIGQMFDALVVLLGLAVVVLSILGIGYGEPLAVFGVALGVLFVAFAARSFVERRELASGGSPLRLTGFLLSGALLLGALALFAAGSLVAGLVVLAVALALAALRAWSVRLQLLVRAEPPVESNP